MTLAKKIEQKLLAEIQPLYLNIIDQSHLHIGHRSNNSDKVESHFKIEIASEKFDPLSKLKRHQLIYQLLDKEIKNLHAVTFSLYGKMEFEATKK